MINQTIDMTVDYQEMGVEQPLHQATLTTYILSDDPLKNTVWPKRPAVIVCPGGGYAGVSGREAEPIAMRYCAAGMHSFILDYSVKPTGWPAAVCELSKAMAYVRSIADEHGIDKDRIYVCGFSAGGHLAASLGVYWTDETVKQFSGVSGEENKPNGMILAYPVITGKPGKEHEGSRLNFMAGRDEVRERFSLEDHVTQDTPKTFLWHTYEDGSVPVANSMLFANALLEQGIEYELHIYPKGGHGLSLGDETTSTGADQLVPHLRGWMDLSIEWVKQA